MERFIGLFHKSSTDTSTPTPILGRNDGPYITGTRDFGDRNARAREDLRIEEATWQSMQALLDRRVDVPIHLLRAQPNLYEQINGQWRDTFLKFRDAIQYVAAVSNGPEDDPNKPPTASSYLYFELLHAGSVLITHDTVDKQRELARKHGFFEEVEQDLDMVEFSTSAGAAKVSMQGTSLVDLVSSSSPINPTKTYIYIVDALVERRTGDFGVFLAENQQYPYGLYPENTRARLVAATGMLLAAINTRPDYKFPTEGEKIAREIFQRTAKFRDSVHRIQQGVNRTLSDPNSPNFAQLREEMSRYVQGSIEQRVLSLHIAGINNPQALRDLYRKSKDLAAKGVEPEFYELMASALKSYHELTSGVFDQLTVDDITDIIDLEDVPDNQSSPDLDQLGKRISYAFSQSSQNTYVIDSSVIGNSALSTPQEIQIQFDRNNPRKFSVSLEFENELGEGLSLSYSVNLIKKTVDWEVLEDLDKPESEEVARIKTTLVGILPSIIESVVQTAQQTHRERSQPKVVDNQVTQKKGRERFVDPIYKLRKEVKAEQKTTKTAQEPEGSASPVDAAIEGQKIRNQVAIPEGSELAKRMHLGSVDSKIVLNSMGEYNEKGTGAKFSRKKKLGPDGRPRYTLSIGCTVPKGARVLLVETDSASGVRRFQVEDIRYRKEVYPKNQM